MINVYITHGIRLVIAYGLKYLALVMVSAFASGALLRLIIYFTIRCEAAFTLEFEKRVHNYLGDPTYEPGITSFHRLTQKILERTFEEHYRMKKKFRRRRFDQLTTLTDRIFQIPDGAKRIIDDTLSQTKYLRRGGQGPKFLEISKFVFESNPIFNRVLGVFSLGTFNDVLNILPGLFVVGGIFGTFMGTMDALPELSRMDITNPESTKGIMDAFLLKMSFSMASSILGIALSVGMTILNTIMNPDGVYYSMVNKFQSSLDFLWNDTTTNEISTAAPQKVDRRAVVYSSVGAKSVNPAPVPLTPQAKIQSLRKRIERLDAANAQLDEQLSQGTISESVFREKKELIGKQKGLMETEIRNLEGVPKVA